MSLKQAIAAIKSGDKAAGKQLLAKVLKAEPRSEHAWIWMTEVVDRDEDRIKCLRNALKINPDNDLVKRRLALLEQKQPEGEQAEQDAAESPPAISGTSLETPKGQLIFNLDTEQAVLDDEPIKLSPVELELLDVLVRHKGDVVSYKQLLEEVWAISEEQVAKSSLDQMARNIYFLQRRFEEDPRNPSLIRHEEGEGYRLG